jgi:Amt family ammonium transporter
LKDSAGNPLPLGLVDGNAGQIVNQVIGSAIAITLAVVGTFIILKVVDLTIGVRADAKEEITGLDLSLHGEEGYAIES